MGSCELCNNVGGELIWQDALCRVVRVNDADYPGFCRVILNRHVKEMTDLLPHERERLMSVVFIVEQVIREVLLPEKINLACLGNVTSHIHWHVIPRFERDRTFPNAIWGASMRASPASTLDAATAQRLKSRLLQCLD